MSTSEGQLTTLFLSLGLSESKSKETLKNVPLSKRLETIANESIKNGFSLQANGKLFYHLASKMKSQHDRHIGTLVKYIGEKKLNTVQRVDAALQFFLNDITIKDSVDIGALEKYCGVGIEVTVDQIRHCVRDAIDSHIANLLASDVNVNRLKSTIIHSVQEELKWAEGKIIVEEVNRLLTDKLNSPEYKSRTGVITENGNVESSVDRKKKDSSSTKGKKSIKESVSKGELDSSDASILDLMRKLNFHKPGENYTTDGYIVTNHTERLLKEHLAITKGRVRTRFPPEPNGILHIGHAKAININFGYAAAHNGVCFLRYDDTNPEREEEKFFVGIRQMVEWLGYEPDKITHSSDYFDKLHELAIKLIEKGLAYVCHQKQDEIKGFNPVSSPWRDRSVEENLTLFECMKNGLYDEGEATLRMKVILEEGKLDPVAYRIKHLPHPRTGQKWCIYPTYDYTHCLCDSIENITHSLCTKEFQSRRSTYYWLCNALDLYCPVQWEYGRLNMNYTVVSKRKIAKLIATGIVRNLDDPRLFTLTALKRRGFPAQAINKFCAKVGVTGAQSVVDPQMLESEVRSELNETAPRVMVITDPLRVKIVNFESLKLPDVISVPDFPSSPTKSGSHTIQLSDDLFIERSDFRSEAGGDYRRLSRDQTVGLKHAGIIIRIKVIEYDRNELPSTLMVSAEKVTPMNKPKAFIHWVSNPIPVEIRLYDKLFLHPNPEDKEQVKNGFLSDINSDSLVIRNGFADKSLLEFNRTHVFQFERVGFFCRDPDSTKLLPVFNRTVTLKEDANKV